jgi:hypothetical protein
LNAFRYNESNCHKIVIITFLSGFMIAFLARTGDARQTIRGMLYAVQAPAEASPPEQLRQPVNR